MNRCQKAKKEIQKEPKKNHVRVLCHRGWLGEQQLKNKLKQKKMRERVLLEVAAYTITERMEPPLKKKSCYSKNQKQKKNMAKTRSYRHRVWRMTNQRGLRKWPTASFSCQIQTRIASAMRGSCVPSFSGMGGGGLCQLPDGTRNQVRCSARERKNHNKTTMRRVIECVFWIIFKSNQKKKSHNLILYYHRPFHRIVKMGADERSQDRHRRHHSTKWAGKFQDSTTSTCRPQKWSLDSIHVGTRLGTSTSPPPFSVRQMIHEQMHRSITGLLLRFSFQRSPK